MLINLCAEAIKPVLRGTKSDGAVKCTKFRCAGCPWIEVTNNVLHVKNTHTTPTKNDAIGNGALIMILNSSNVACERNS